MPKENYGRNGMSVKPNTNAEGVIDEAADPIDPEAISLKDVAAKRAADAPENEAATERSEASQKL